MTDTNILVTGATSGLGREMAQQLAARGERVIASGRREARLAELEAQDRITGLKLDLSHPDDITAAIAKLQPLSGVILNAGITFAEPFTSGDLQTDISLIQTNVTANLQLIRELLPTLKTNQGRILIVASLAGMTPVPYQ